MVAVGCGRRHLTVLGTAWASPNSLIGLGFALLSGALPRRRDGLLIAQSNRGLAKLFLTRRGFGAITFGRVVISAIPLTPELLCHESHHARQYEVLGPFYIPIYLFLQARHGYLKNPLEVEAAACAAHTAASSTAID
jgi:hypothetical protein